ncbi:hypothetical protein [Pantoea sp. CCBC3-3-1]|uniref:hypothetical protein n=1 Tax=Pantoea sp. CCBC3-3-1 TaxID=2490851 RepID=UPI0011BE6F12|nr:hypothetical protein [Pantoea sp. CCBC3-3-1]
MFTNLPHMIQFIQGLSWIPLTAFCAVFGYAAVRWIGNTFFPERYVTLNRYHNDRLISSVQIDVKSAEPLVEQLRKIREAERGW